jgi:hypothetical protein
MATLRGIKNGQIIETIVSDTPPQPSAARLARLRARTQDAVDAERDRRIDAGVTFNGVRFQTRSADRENVAGATQLATLAVMAGAQAGNLRWHGGASDFAWIAEDNSVVLMDAMTVIAFGQAVAAHKSAHIFAARALKDAETIPPNYTDDQYWPET